jgi:hypothetical protein
MVIGTTMTRAEILKRCSNGERLCKTLHLKQSGNAEITFCLETSGAHVSRRHRARS